MCILSRTVYPLTKLEMSQNYPCSHRIRLVLLSFNFEVETSHCRSACPTEIKSDNVHYHT